MTIILFYGRPRRAGFADDSDFYNDIADDYTYDLNGNLKTDANKNITAIVYNHLNLPTNITFAAKGTIEYIYNLTGQKVQKIVNSLLPTPTVTTTDYLGGFQYKNSVLEYFPTSEGYVKNTVVNCANNYSYVYNYTDHLGNVRVSYENEATGSLKILEENNYYPFGLKHQLYNTDTSQPNYKYKYNGKELQDELNLNLYDCGARNYDPALGRWMNIDPLAELSRRFSPYVYALNNPVFFIDPDGMKAEAGQTANIYYDWDEGGYRTQGGDVATQDEAMAQFDSDGEKESSPDDWIKNKETGEVKWFDGTGKQAENSAVKHWGFFDGRGKTENLGSSFFGTTGNSQIITEKISYLLSASLKINSMAGVKQDGINNLAFEYLMSVYFGTPFGKSSEKSSELPGVIWDYGGANFVEKKLPTTAFVSFAFKALDIYLSSQAMGAASDRASHDRANAVNYFKTITINYITPTTLFNINLHKF